MENFEESPAPVGPTSSKERMRTFRERTKLMKAHEYVRPIQDVAKDALREMKEPSVEALLEREEFSIHLGAGQISQLKTFVKNLRQQRKREDEATLEKAKDDLSIRDRAQRIGNVEISELDRILCETNTVEERVQLMRAKIEENIFVFCEYMEILKPRSDDFLKHIIEFYEELEESKFTMLFVRVCVMHRGERLAVKSEMVNLAMKFLIESKMHPTAALGLLKLAYSNNIAFSDFSVDQLVRFETIYENQIIHFIKSLQGVRQPVVDSLPPTIFIFAAPLLNALLQGGGLLYAGVPPQFLPYLVAIVSYSFNGDQPAFEQFIAIFKEGCSKLYDALLQSDFQNLLQFLTEQAKERSAKYFGEITNYTKVVKASFGLLLERQIGKFDNATAKQLVFGSSEVLTMLQQRPKIISNITSITHKKIIDLIAKQNPLVEFDHKVLSNPLGKDSLLPFAALGISTLLEVQELAFKILVNAGQQSRIFIMYETGQGKTALCMAIATTKALAGGLAIVLNQSVDLTFRDYKKSLAIMQKLPISVKHLEQNGDLDVQGGCILYASVEKFFDGSINHDSLNIEQVTIILDEFDSFIFNETPSQEMRIKCMFRFPCIFGLSGSDLQVQHKMIMENILMATLINMHVRDRNNSQVICKSTITTDKKQSYLASLLEIVQQQTALTPIILIMDIWSEQICKQINSQSIRAENLSIKDAPEIEALMGTFTMKNNGRYGVFIISQDQGRGLDFPSNSDIEQSGGVYLIIGCLPINFLSFHQQIGRTGRIGNRGQYSVVIFSRDCKNMDGESFFKLKLEELKNKDIQGVSKLSQNLQKIFKVDTIVNFEEDNSHLELEKYLQGREEEKVSVGPLRQVIHSSELNCDETLSQPLLGAGVTSDEENAESANIKLVPNVLLDLKKRKIKEIDKFDKINQRIGQSRDRKRVDRDLAYFESYATPEIHREMTEDTVRMSAYNDAINAICKDCFVIDAGAGSGVLCVMAARAGASKVIGVEFSDYYRVAQESIRDNGLEQKVEIVHSLAEDFILTDIKADVLVSEWMGYFLIFENMLPSVLAVKEQALKQEGTMIPRRAKILLAAFERPEEINGIVLRSLEKVASINASIELVSEQRIITDSTVILDLDLSTLAKWRNEFSSPFELVATKQSSAKGLVGWFDAELAEGVTLSTSPLSQPTHWKQTLFYFQKEIQLDVGEILVGNIEVVPNADDHRGLQFQIEVGKQGSRKPFRYSYWLQ